MNEDTGGGPRPGRLTAALALTALLATACSGAHPSGSGASPAPGNVQQLDVFAACMRSHGVLNFYFSNSPHTSDTSNGKAGASWGTTYPA